MSKNKKSKKSKGSNLEGASDLIKSQNQSHNTKKEALGENTKK